MTTISGLGGSDRSRDSGQSRKAEHEARRFAKADSDGSGGVDATELAAMLENAPSGDASGNSAELLKTMDSDGDGSLNRDELSQGLHDLMPRPASTLGFAQSRGAANDGDAFAAPPAQSSSTVSTSTSTSTSATSTDYDPLDVNQDGTVSQIERLAGQLKEFAQTAGSDGSQGSAGSDIAALAQKLYDQLSKNWLQTSGTDSQLSVTA